MSEPLPRQLPLGYWPAVNRWLLLLLGHIAVMTIIYSVLYCFEVVKQLPSDQVLGRWDAGWYQFIRDHGYSYDESKQSNVAFFPLFPYFWRCTGLSLLGISIVNLLTSLVGIALLVAALPCTRRQGLLLASVPLLLFTWVPYTEALFYLFGALLLVGLHRQHLGWLLLGLLGCCLTRAAATFFVPALCFAELLAWLDTRATKAGARNLLLGLLVMALAIGSVLWFQHAQTGEWLGFYKTQRHWYHEWRLPLLPLHSTAWKRMEWLDAISLAAALSAAISGIYLLAKHMGQPRTPAAAQPVSKAVLFSLGYCVCVGVFTVFQQGGDVSNSSRYILGTPFFAVLLWAAWQRAHHWATWVLALVTLAIVLYFLGFPNHFTDFSPAQSTWYVALVGGYVAASLAAGSTRSKLSFQRELSGAVYLFNTFMQVYLFNWFLDSVWLG